jgi:hypothetical protein
LLSGLLAPQIFAHVAANHHNQPAYNHPEKK